MAEWLIWGRCFYPGAVEFSISNRDKNALARIMRISGINISDKVLHVNFVWNFTFNELQRDVKKLTLELKVSWFRTFSSLFNCQFLMKLILSFIRVEL